MPGKRIRPRTIFLAFFLAITLGCWTQGTYAGISNPVMIKDIYPGVTSGIMGYAPVNLNGIVYFSATDGSPYIYNLWRSDGTSQGTIALTYSGPRPYQLVVLGNSLYFSGIYPGSGQYELYGYDSISGTFTRLTDDSVDPYVLTVQGNSLYFSGNSGNQRVPWKSDGTVSGTTVLPISGVSYPGDFTVLGDRLYFNGGSGGADNEPWENDLWEYDITNGTGARLTVGGVNPLDLTVLGDRLYFCGNSGSGWELWEYDSTSGTSAVLTSGGVNPVYLTVLGGNLYFSGFNSGTTTCELWKSDGTVSGTTMLTSGGVEPYYLTVLGGNLYFNGYSNLWKSDGTASGTTMLTNSSLYPYDLTVLGNRLYFNGYSRDADVTWKTELWEYDSVSGTSTALTHTSVEPQELVNANNILFFYGTDPAHGTELWKYIPVFVNHPPIANSQNLSLNEDSSLAIILRGSDPDNDPLTYSIVTAPAHGTLSGTTSNIIYTPTPLYYGTDSFTFKVNDGHVDSFPVIVNLIINQINPPASTGLLYSRSNLTVGDNPNSVTAADLNGDGRPDLVVANSGDNNVSVLLGNGNGTFQTAVNYVVGEYPYSMAVGDLNGDDRLDLITANWFSNNVSVLLGNGDGTFQMAVNYEVGNSPTSVAVGDVNGDGHLDLVVAISDDNAVFVLPGNGDGTFAAAVNYAVGEYPYSVAIGDLNGDSRPDIVVANYGSNNLSILLGNGDGTFAAAVSYAVGDSPNSVAVGDLNGDGHPDLVTANDNSNNLSVLLGHGDGTFQVAVNYAVGECPYSLIMGDLNNDGHLDLVVANSGSNTVSVLLGNGDGTFQTAVNYAVGEYPYSVAVGDLNGDGNPDLITANGENSTVSVLFNNKSIHAPIANPQSLSLSEDSSLAITLTGWDLDNDPINYQIGTRPGHGTLIGTAPKIVYIPDPGFYGLDRFTFQVNDGCNYSTPAVIDLAINHINPPASATLLFNAVIDSGTGAGPLSVAVGDLNGDGHPDLVTPNWTDNNISVLLGNGDGTFQTAVEYAVGDHPYSVAVGDLNGDGHPDLVAANWTDDNISVLLGNGDGTFQTAVNYAVGSYPCFVAVADLNGDGRPDLVVANKYSKNVSVLLGNGDGTFKTAVNYGAGDGPISVAVGDLNRDGHPDLVVANWWDNTVSVLWGNGGGTFQTALNYTVGKWPSSLALGDLNSDGHPDLVVTNSGDNTLSMLLGYSDGTFQAAANYTVGKYPHSVAMGDLNGDGHPDLVVSNSTDMNMSVLLGFGDGTFQITSNYEVPLGPDFVTVADLNGDGHLDLVTANAGGNTASALLGKGDGTFATANRYGVGYHPNSVVTGDLNGDGYPDLVVANSGDNYISVLISDGTGTFPTMSYYWVGYHPAFVAVADLNGDGHLDLVTANAVSNTVSVLLGNGDGTFQEAIDYAVGYVPWSVAVDDLNGDGHPDLVTANTNSNTVSVLLGNGDGTFQTAVEYGAGNYPISVAVGDLNGDGHPDLVTANDNSNNLSVLLGNGDGTFQATVNYGVGSYPDSVAVADLNGDGRPDLITANSIKAASDCGTLFGDDTVSVLLGNGDGTFATAVKYKTGNFPSNQSACYGAGNYPSSVAVGDLNGDGHPDLVVANSWSEEVSVLQGNGDGTFQTAVNYGAGNFPSSVAIGDLDGDHRPDLVVTNYGDYTVSVLINRLNYLNHPPVADPQSLSLNENSSLAITLNGSDVDNDPLTYSIGSNPSKGTLSGTAPNITYTPNLGVYGTDSFTYKVNDGYEDSAPATVSLTINLVNYPPVADPQSLSLNQGSSLAITLTGSDPDNDPLTYSIVTNPSHGTLSGSAPNSAYTPNPGFHGSDSFTFKVNDGYEDSAPAIVNLTIDYINHPPVANPQDLLLNQGNSYAVTLTGSDPDNDPLTYSILTQPRHGTLTGTAPNLIYTSRLNYTGTDNFTFKVNDGYVDSAPAAVNLAIHANIRPVANPQSLTLIQNTSLLILLTGSDVDNDLLTFQIRTSPSHGTLTGTAPNLTYTPSSNYRGTDSFTFRVNDGHANSTSATIGLTVIRRNNQTLVANPQSLTLNENTGIPITLTGWDAANKPLTFQIVTAPLYGTLSGTAPNLFYTPNAFFYGLDSLTFLVNNGLVTASAIVKFSIKHINNPPKAVNDIKTTYMETPVTIDVLNNDSDPDVGDTLSVTYVSPPPNGTANINSDDTITYTPNPGYGGIDNFIYKITDHHGGTAWAWITVTVLCKDPQIISFTANNANETTITYGQSVTLAWTAKYCSSGRITGTDGFRKAVSPNDTMTVTPGLLGKNEYTLRIINNSYCGGAKEATVVVKVNPIPVTMSTKTHLGFDKSFVESVKNMRNWWNSSPYYVTILYLPGALNRSKDINLDSDWVQTVLGQGWGLIPIWFGLQEPNTDCTNCPHKFSSDPTQAYNSGVSEAMSAIATMQTLGLGKTIIYKDIENYSDSNSGVTTHPARSFLKGWVEKLHEKGYLAGVYGNPDPAKIDFSKVTPKLDAVWIASTQNPPRITIWGLSPLSDDQWTNHQRMHQFLIKQKKVKFGAAQPFDEIDDDIIAAPVVVGQGVQRVKDFIKNYDPMNPSCPYSFNKSDDPSYDLHNFPPELPIAIMPRQWRYTNLGIYINDINSANGSFINNEGQTAQIAGSSYYRNIVLNLIGEIDQRQSQSYNFLGTTDASVDLGGLTWIPEITGFNNSGSAVGSWTLYQPKGIEKIASQGFVYNNNSGNFGVPGMSYTFAYGINDAGQIVGSCSTDDISYHGFFRSGTTTQIIDYPGATSTKLCGINGAGQAVGYYSEGAGWRPFIYENGQFSRPFVVEGAVAMQFIGINNNSQIVGNYWDTNYYIHGFLYDMNGNKNKIVTIDYPFQSSGNQAVTETYALGINDFGQITGAYRIDNYDDPDNPTYSIHYFLATPKL